MEKCNSNRPLSMPKLGLHGEVKTQRGPFRAKGGENNRWGLESGSCFEVDGKRHMSLHRCLRPRKKKEMSLGLGAKTTLGE